MNFFNAKCLVEDLVRDMFSEIGDESVPVDEITQKICEHFREFFSHDCLENWPDGSPVEEKWKFMHRQGWDYFVDHSKGEINEIREQNRLRPQPTPPIIKTDDKVLACILTQARAFDQSNQAS